MVSQLQVFGSEVSRVAREVGTEGKLGGQAQITGVSGIWKELTENVYVYVRDDIENTILITIQQRYGYESHSSSPGNRGCHNSRGRG